jgi:hypothetical protein
MKLLYGGNYRETRQEMGLLASTCFTADHRNRPSLPHPNPRFKLCLILATAERHLFFKVSFI